MFDENIITKFNEKRDNIYNNAFYTGDTLLTKDISPHKAFTEPIDFGGYIIAYEIPESISEQIEYFSHKLKETLPGMVTYDKKNSHISIAVFNESDNFNFNPDNLKDLESGVINAIRTGIFPIDISFGKYLGNQQAIIAPGYACDEFVINQENIAQSLYNIGIANSKPENSFKKAVMSHATVARFTKSYISKELSNSDLGNILNSSLPLNNSSSEKLDKLIIGYYKMNNSGFLLEKSCTISLK